MELLCKVCDREILENESERNIYLATKYTVYNINLDEINKILSDYISHHSKKFVLYFIKCEFEIDFDNNFTANIQITYQYKTDTNNIKRYLIYYIDSCKSRGYKFSNINH